MNPEKYDKMIFQLAESFLTSLKTKDGQPVTNALVSKYIDPAKPPSNLSGIYFRLLQSAQNANMKSGVIGGSINGIENLKVVLCGFHPKDVLKKYGEDDAKVFADIKRYVKPRGKVNPNGLWPQYCRTIISGAKFMAKFNSSTDFYKWVNFFDKDDRARPALPLLVQNQIKGFRLALACDFLKELGYFKFAKPDVHLRNIFVSLSLCSKDANDFELLESIIRVAKNSGVDAYHADKVFWLIGSGNFYKDKKKTGRNAKKFIDYVRSQ